MLRPAGRRANVLHEVHALLARIGMGDYAKRKVSELAYGHQRLVEIAMALALEPRVLLLDEPAAGIPTAELAVLIDVIEQLDPAITVLIIEHDMELVRRVAREATVLVAGRVLLEGAIGAVMASDEVHRVYLGRAAGARKAEERIDAVG
jgi:ABC-type branched-subunit amino acid transport system ATPase component